MNFRRLVLVTLIAGAFIAERAFAASEIKVLSIDGPARLNMCPKEPRKCFDVPVTDPDGTLRRKKMRIQEGVPLPVQGNMTLFVPVSTTVVLEAVYAHSESVRITLKSDMAFQIQVSDKDKSLAGKAIKALDFFNVNTRSFEGAVRASEFVPLREAKP